MPSLSRKSEWSRARAPSFLLVFWFRTSSLETNVRMLYRRGVASLWIACAINETLQFERRRGFIP